MNTVTACFACTSPYQIMGAISIVCAEKLNADLARFQEKQFRNSRRSIPSH